MATRNNSAALVQQIQFPDGEDALTRNMKLRALALTVFQLSQQANQQTAASSSTSSNISSQPFLVYSSTAVLTQSKVLAANAPLHITSGGNTVIFNPAEVLLEQLGDVNVNNIATGQILIWSGSRWVNKPQSALSIGWTQITGTPTTLAGYGITDGVNISRQVLAGPGLIGGGALSSDVTLSLDNPSRIPGLPVFIPEDPSFDEPMIVPGPQGNQGVTGPTGSQGPIGPALFLITDDPPEGDMGPPGPPGIGTPGSTGAQGPTGLATHLLVDEGWPDEGMIQSPGSATLPTGPIQYVLTANGLGNPPTFQFRQDSFFTTFAGGA